MRYYNETRIRLHGDKQQAVALIPRARVVLGQLVNDLQFQDLKTGTKTQTVFEDARSAKNTSPQGSQADGGQASLSDQENNEYFADFGQDGPIRNEPYERTSDGQSRQATTPARKPLYQIIATINHGIATLDIIFPHKQKRPEHEKFTPFKNPGFLILCRKKLTPFYSQEPKDSNLFFHLVEPKEHGGEVILNASGYNETDISTSGTVGGAFYYALQTWEGPNGGGSWQQHSHKAIQMTFKTEETQDVVAHNFVQTSNGAVCFPFSTYDAPFSKKPFSFPSEYTSSETFIDIPNNELVGMSVPSVAFACGLDETIPPNTETTDSYKDVEKSTTFDTLTIDKSSLSGYYVLCAMTYIITLGPTSEYVDTPGKAAIHLNGHTIDKEFNFSPGEKKQVTGSGSGNVNPRNYSFSPCVTLINPKEGVIHHFSEKSGNVFNELFSLAPSYGGVIDYSGNHFRNSYAEENSPLKTDFTPVYKTTVKDILSRFKPEFTVRVIKGEGEK